MITVGDVYRILDGFAPFRTQEKWDHSGLLAGAMEMPAQRIFVTLDISSESIAAAKAWGAQLIVSHHPVIFTPLQRLTPQDPVWQLAENHMAAICIHTPLDIAAGGINDAVWEQLKEPLQLSEITGCLEPTQPDGRGFGWICSSEGNFSAAETAELLRQILGCTAVRYHGIARPLQRIAFCSGSAASMLETAAERGCDALITGDVKHDRWYAAQNLDVALFDCGHYHTERIAAEILKQQIAASLPEAEIRADAGADPAEYAIGGTI